jgi:hypothetical protein
MAAAAAYAVCRQFPIMPAQRIGETLPKRESHFCQYRYRSRYGQSKGFALLTWDRKTKRLRRSSVLTDARLGASQSQRGRQNGMKGARPFRCPMGR